MFFQMASDQRQLAHHRIRDALRLTVLLRLPLFRPLFINDGM
jgi:hypothetical protein